MNRSRIAGVLTLGALLAGCGDSKGYQFSGTIDGEQANFYVDIGAWCKLHIFGTDRDVVFTDYDCDGSLNRFSYNVREESRNHYHTVLPSSETEQEVFAQAQEQYTAYRAKIKAEKERLGFEALGVKR